MLNRENHLPEFNFWNLHRGGRRERIPQFFLCMYYGHTCLHPVRIIYNVIKIFLTCKRRNLDVDLYRGKTL